MVALQQTGKASDNRFGLLRELTPGDADHLIAGREQVGVASAVVLEGFAVGVKGVAVDLDNEAASGQWKSTSWPAIFALRRGRGRLARPINPRSSRSAFERLKPGVSRRVRRARVPCRVGKRAMRVTRCGSRSSLRARAASKAAVSSRRDTTVARSSRVRSGSVTGNPSRMRI